MPVQQINVKNSSEIENFEWTMAPFQQNICGDARMGSSSSQTSYSNSSGDICRICHCESDSHNPLLAPCYCSGSLKYVHQSCLQQWLTASDTRSCELCKFNFIMHTKIKPFNEWRLLEMSGVERRRLCCAVLFHCVAALCVMWSLFVLIERAVEEVNKGLIAWPFWTKLVVVAVGFTGGAVFMYIQCRQYLSLCSRWRTHNRILLIQNAPEKMHPVSQSPPRVRRERAVLGQVVANIEDEPAPPHVRQFHVEQHPLPPEKPASYTEEDESGGFESYKFNPYRRVSSVNENKLFLSSQPEKEIKSMDLPENRRYSDTRLMQALDTRHSTAIKMETFNQSARTEPILDPMKMQHPLYTSEVTTSASTSGNYLCDNVYHISNQFDPPVSLTREYETRPQVSDIIFRPELDPLEFNIRQMLELDAQSTHRKPSVLSLNHEQVMCQKPGAVFKSLPNLSASSENLLPQKPNS